MKAGSGPSRLLPSYPSAPPPNITDDAMSPAAYFPASRTSRGAGARNQ
jgi:hypothetical protein